MEGILQTVLKPIRIVKEKTAVPPKNELNEEIKSLREQLRNVHNRFNLYTDFDMTDACIYEMEALEARYRFLIKKAKKDHAEKAPVYSMKQE